MEPQRFYLCRELPTQSQQKKTRTRSLDVYQVLFMADFEQVFAQQKVTYQTTNMFKINTKDCRCC